MKKAATTKRKTGNRAKQAPARSTARRPRAKPTASAKARAPRSRSAKAQTSSKPRIKSSALASLAGVYSSDEGKTFLLMLAPFMVTALAVAASQSMMPDPLRMRIAQVPVSTERAEAVPVTALAELSLSAQSSGPLVRTVAPSGTISEAKISLAKVDAIPAGSGPEVVPVKTGPPLPPAPTDTALVGRTTTFAEMERCEAPADFGPKNQHQVASNWEPEQFGRLLASAAKAQTNKLVIYTDKYRRIGFPMGDVPDMYGVCTDVVIRAYRSLGIDLQELVHKARIGTGDPSIDHRRTKILRRFFEKHGISLPITDYAEDYHPGDIVTYHRAQGRGSQSHIAIVSDVIAPSGRPMIVHNRGWGPQVEDALFAHQVTGHYRFTGAEPAAETPSSQAMLDAGTRAQQ